MNIILNGENTEVSDGTTVLSLLEEKNTDPRTVIAEVDGDICKPEDFENVSLKEGSVVEVLRFVGGG